MQFWLGVENFAKIEYAKICINEYTLLVGQNNSGKTFLMQLVQGMSKKLAELVSDDIIDIFAEEKSDMYCKCTVSEACVIPFVETHNESKGEDKDNIEIVNLDYNLSQHQYGIYANEFRSPLAAKEGSKKADVLACIVDQEKKVIYTTIFDVKSNISAFSDDLLKTNTMQRAIKEVRDFTIQIHDEILHKNSFILYYKDDGYSEFERVGIATKSFEKEKFLAVADLLEQLFLNDCQQIPEVLKAKMKTMLTAYRGEAERVRAFAEKKILLNNKEYELHVFLLKQISETTSETEVQVGWMS